MPPDTPMGATLDAGGATFRLWAPGATSVSVRGSFNGWVDLPLVREEDRARWSRHVPGVREGDEYKFFVAGSGSTGWKRDPYARALTFEPPFPNSNGIVTRPAAFPWHDSGFRSPEFADLVIYQLHVGAFWATDASGADIRASTPGRFLDVVAKLPHLAALGINAIQLMPIQEFANQRSLGYNGVDYFSPEMAYCHEPGDPGLASHLDRANAILAERGLRPYRPSDIASQPDQLRALVDLCHVLGIAVILDVVYNHAGGDFDDESLFFLDRQPAGDNNRSLYFTKEGWAGGLVFAYWQAPVRQFLIDNATTLLAEFRVDGFRFDEVTVIDRFGGWSFAQDLTDTLRYANPRAILIAEYWATQWWAVAPRAQGGAGFDAVLASGLREAIRATVAESISGADASLSMARIAQALPPAFGEAWRQVQHLENHDIVRVDNTSDREPRVPMLADPSCRRSWYARSRSRVATGLLLTAPGIPMLFMGQEFLEDKYWSDNPAYFQDSLIAWDGLATVPAMRWHLRFVSELLRLRATLPALRRGGIRVHHCNDGARVLAFHRWLEGEGQDVVVVCSLQESTWWSYQLGFPFPGAWREIFNSDFYDQGENPAVAGNHGAVQADGPPRDGFAASCAITVPANGLLVFARGPTVQRSSDPGR